MLGDEGTGVLPVEGWHNTRVWTLQLGWGQQLVELKQHGIPLTPCSSVEPPPKIISIF